ncbi:MAG TPA: glucose-6-phosphate isomerase [Firmicutes bacterium]|nr:glucose-6-phosphate isomerase [Bacillota bacterium]
MKLNESTEHYNLHNGCLEGKYAVFSQKKLAQLKGVFADEQAFAAKDGEEIVYEVSSHTVVPEGTPGGLFFGTSCIHPGTVGGEYYMTKGHFHAKRECGEYYWGISGTGLLLLMDENRNCTAQLVKKNSLHYISGYTAHRLVNIGDDDLVVGACWPSDAGHDYGSIETEGFPVRVICRDGEAVIVDDAHAAG